MGALKKFAMILSCVFLLPETSPATNDFSESLWVMPPAASIKAQFWDMPVSSGYPFTFSYWNDQLPECEGDSGCFIGDDPTSTKHYQGVNRVQAPDGTAYLYLTRNGNPFTAGTDWPGEILVVQMGDRNRTGEALQENPTGTDNGQQQPRRNDFTVRSIHLNGEVDGKFQWISESGIDLTSRIDWKHPGSGQQVGNLLFIPVEKTCNYIPEEGKCGGGEVKRGAILVLKLADENDPDITPANPGVACQIEYFNDLVSNSGYFQLPIIGTLAVARTDEGGYLFAHTAGGSYNGATALTFYEVSEVDLCANADSLAGIDIPFIGRTYVWNAGNLQDANGTPIGSRFWRYWDDVGPYTCRLDWQMINFVHGTDGQLYLIGTDKCQVYDLSGIPYWPRDDVSALYQIESLPDQYVVKYLTWRQYYLNDPVDIGSFDAVGGIYVTPTNRLVIYSGAHDNDWPRSIVPTFPICAAIAGSDGRCTSLEMGEFASQYYHPPVVTPQADEEVFTFKMTLFALGTFTDTEEDDQTWEVKIDWGDGNTEQVTRFLPGELGPVEHRYWRPGEYSVTMRVIDSDGFSGAGVFNVMATEYANGDGGGGGGSGGGGNDDNWFGCSISSHEANDPTLPLLVLLSVIYLARKRLGLHSRGIHHSPE